MVLVRFEFNCKWGTSGEVATLMSEGIRIMEESLGARRVRVLTDLSGKFNRVIQEVEIESMAEWEATRGEIFQHPEFLKNQEKMSAMIESGSMELYTIEYEG
jgi:hypothetical protein